MKKYLILFFVAAAAAFQSCDNNDDLWDAIDDLKSRVSALETQVDALNGNIEAMQTLYNGGATVSEVTEADGAYVIKLTDGTTLTLTQGSEAEAVIPVVSIDANGNWQYSVDGGKSFISLGQNAVAEDGTTPQFRIDESTGCWQVNTTGEESGWTNVKDSAGKDVSAVGGEVTDKFFDSVRVDGDTLYIKLLGSDVELEVPILADVLCAIVDAEGNPIEEIQMFDSGQERSFTVKMKGIDNTIVTAPEGWTARLTAPVDEVATLFVKAPGTQASAGTTATRATANTSQDVAILATSGKYSFISKIQVQSTGVEAEPPTVTSVTSSVATDVTLMFDVQIANADGWKYICLESGSEAPDAAKVFAEGTAVLGTSVTVEGLEAQTEYTIYVVAYIGEQYSEVSTATGTTAAEPVDPNDYYKAGVKINGVLYNSESPNAQLLAESKDFTSDDFSEAGVYFLESGDNAPSYTIQGTMTSDQVFIGRYADSKLTLSTTGNVNLNNPSATVIFKNLKVDMKNYIQMSPDSGVAYLIFEDCEIDFGSTQAYFITTGSSATVGSAHIENIVFRNCKIHYVGTANSNFIVATNADLTGQSNFKSVIFENNLVYMDSQLKSCVLFNGNNNTFENLTFTFDHNTVINYLPNGGQGAVLVTTSCAGLTSLTYNIYYSDPSLTRSSSTAGFRVMSGTTADVIGAAPVTPNVGYGVFSGTNGVVNYQGGTRITVETSPFSSTDYNTGTFVKASEYADYGSTLE